MTEAHTAASDENTVQEIVKCLYWITQRKMQQKFRQQLEHPKKAYHLYLESTYKALTRSTTIREAVESLDTLPAPESPSQPPTPLTETDTVKVTLSITSGLQTGMELPSTHPTEHQIVPPSEISVQQVGSKRVPPLTRPTQKAACGHKRNFCEEEIYLCSDRYEQPNSKREGVAISQSRLPGAGRGLFGIRPIKHNPFFLNKHMNLFASTPQCKTLYQWKRHKYLSQHTSELTVRTYT
jgi:hypothetical protein